MNIATAPSTAHVTGWDRAVVIALGGAGCALSYDALQQMAVAIHVRGLLTYLFPLVIDGFIAYGIRALLVLRDAPLRARLYVWTLFGTATAASIWANALHAVRLNQETASANGLRLGNTVVAVLSTIAPLALAGAVHLYILIARGPVKDGDRSDRDDLGHPGQPERVAVTRTDRAAGQQQSQPGQVSAGQPVTALTDRPRLSLGKQTPAARTPRSGTAPRRTAVARTPVTMIGGSTPLTWADSRTPPRRSVTDGPSPSRSPVARTTSRRSLTGRSLRHRSLAGTPGQAVTGDLTRTPRSCWRSPGQRSGPRTS